MSKHKHSDKSDKSNKEPKMSTLEQLEMLYASGDPPITPQGKNSYIKANIGYKFYLKVREHLPAWWEEFNSELDSDSRLRYASIRTFIKKKTNKSEEQRWLYRMCGPAIKYADGHADVPWLGDWEKRRRAGFGVLDDPEKLKPLIKVIHSNLAAAESIRSLTPILAEELVQYTNLQKQVHEAFAGKAFKDGRPADHKSNTSRFNAYKAMLWALSELKFKVVAEIMRVHGVDPNAPQQMRDMAQIAGGIGAAAALTGIAAGQRIPGLGVGMSLPDGTTAITPYTYDAIKLAEHFTRHAHTYKKPLPIVEGEEVEYEEEKRSHKGNGKVV